MFIQNFKDNLILKNYLPGKTTCISDIPEILAKVA